MRKHYDESFKREAVELLVSTGRPLKVLAAELGVSPAALRSWRDRHFRSASPAAGDSAGDPKALYEEMKALRRENELLRRQRDILKKALSIVSDPPTGGMR